MILLTLTLLACDAQDCGSADALSTCLEPTQSADYYAAQSSAYFDTMDYTVDHGDGPPYSELVARWEWAPWLKLTAFGRENIASTDALLVLYPSVVLERDCRGFDTQPFGRCRVVFYYDAHEGRPCPIYEEFTFNDQGEITFIEAWSDQPSMMPMPADDTWAEGEAVDRLANRVPGLGNPTGQIDLDSEAMASAAAEDAVLADFVYRANNWQETWLAELEASDQDQMWEVGCGW